MPQSYANYIYYRLQTMQGGEESLNNDDLNSDNHTPESGESGLDPQSKRISKNEKRYVASHLYWPSNYLPEFTSNYIDWFLKETL